jgi:hypothetical protein
MLPPKKFKSWLEKIKAKADVQDMDLAAFDVAITNYELLYSAWKAIKADLTSKTATTQNLYKTLLSNHQKFLEDYGLTGKSRFKRDVITARLKIDTDKTPDLFESFNLEMQQNAQEK